MLNILNKKYLNEIMILSILLILILMKDKLCFFSNINNKSLEKLLNTEFFPIQPQNFNSINFNKLMTIQNSTIKYITLDDFNTQINNLYSNLINKKTEINDLVNISQTIQTQLDNLKSNMIINDNNNKCYDKFKLVDSNSNNVRWWGNSSNDWLDSGRRINLVNVSKSTINQFIKKIE